MINKTKRGVSVLVGYVLLIVFAIIISAGVYTWLKTYVPAETLNCKDGVSFFVKEADFNNSLSQQLNVTIRNNGRFSIAGYFIHATNNSEQKLATIDLSQYLNSSYDGIVFGNSVLFSVTSGNTLKPGEEVTHVFDVPLAFGSLYSLDIVPTIFQTENNKERFVSCSDEQVKQVIGEAGGSSGSSSAVCGNSAVETGEQCDDGNTASGDGCSATCQIEQAASCNNNGIKESGELCDGSDFGNLTGCSDLGYDTGTLACSSQCTFDTSQCYNCATIGQVPDGSGGCTTIGNGVCDAGETCSQEPVACEGLQASCSVGQSCQSGDCAWEGGAYGEDEYCIDLGHAGGGNCVANTGQCTSQNGVNENSQPGASIYCPGQVLCCFN